MSGVDPFHQHPKSLHSPIPLLALTFHSVTLGCLVLFNVCWSRYFTHAVCICYRLFLLLCLSFDQEMMYSFRRVPPTI